MILNFFIDKDHFPYQFKDDLSFKSKNLLDALGGTNTWLLWTLRTYLELKEHFDCNLTDVIPESGITFFFRGSINFTQKPNKNQFWVCMVADAVWHPYSHVNLFQNHSTLTAYPQSFFIRHWHQLSIIKSKSVNSSPQNIYYFGDKTNLAPMLRSEDWQSFIEKNGFKFQIPPFSKWNDYSVIDVVIGIRSFNGDEIFLNKPSSKLINAWRANVVFIGGSDSAYTYERQTSLDYIDVKTYDELKTALLNLTNDNELFHKYRQQSVKCAERFPDTFFVDQWISLINNKILPLYQQSIKAGSFAYYKFLFARFVIYKSQALAIRFKKAITSTH